MARTCRTLSDAVLVLLGGMLLVLWGVRLWASASGGKDLAGPSATIASTERDLGTLRQGEVLRVTFPIRNSGSRRLIVRRLSATCCGGQESGPTLVMPGDSALLELEVDTSRWCGQMRETADFATNDPRLPRFTLCVAGQVRGEG